MDLSFIGPRVQSALGIAAFIAIAWLLSERKSRFPLLQTLVTVPLQIAIAALFLRFDAARAALSGLNGVVLAVNEATLAGTGFLFGYLGRSEDMPFQEAAPGAYFVFAFQALPLLVVVSALAAVLWHWGLLKVVIRGFAMALSRVLGTGGAVSLAASGNVLLGQTEAPLLIRAYLAKLTRSELFTVISCGYATVAGTVMVLYATILSGLDLGGLGDAVLGHIIVASIIAVLGALMLGRIMVPPAKGEAPTPASAGEGFAYEDTMDAFVTGATEGGKLWANIVIAILAFVALVALLNIVLDAWVPDVAGAPLTLERMLGWLFAPLVWLAGVPWDQAVSAGGLMGVKTAVNEVVAYIALVNLEPGTLDGRSTLIMVYALCGFANVASIGIVIGGLSALEPARRRDVLDLAPKALVAGTLATLGSAACVGLVY